MTRVAIDNCRRLLFAGLFRVSVVDWGRVGTGLKGDLSTFMIIQPNLLCKRSNFSVIGFRFCRFYRIMRELKNPVAKYYPKRDLNPVLTFVSCMLLPELILLFAGSLRPLDPYAVMLY